MRVCGSRWDYWCLMVPDPSEDTWQMRPTWWSMQLLRWWYRLLMAVRFSC